MNINLIVKAMTSGKYVVNGKYQWKAMVADIEAKDPHCFDGIDNPAEKIRKMVSTKQMRAQIAAAEAKKLKKAEKKAAKKANAKAKANKPVVVESSLRKNGDITRTVAIDSEKTIDLMTEDEILVKLGYDPTEMQMVSSTVRMSNWDAQTASGTKTMNSYRISATVRKKTELSTADYERISREAAEMTVKRPARKPMSITGNRCAIINLADVHYGCLAEADQCGRDYNLEIAEQNIYHVIEESIAKIKEVGGVKQIYLHWAQDFFHCNGRGGKTAKGTPLDMCCSPDTMYRRGLAVLEDIIAMLAEVAPVDTFYTESNHSPENSWHAALHLAGRFADDPNVTIDCTRMRRKYRKFGNHLFGFGHGDKEGRKISFNPSIDVPQLWGQVDHREMFLGHVHHAKVEDVEGVVLRYGAALVAPDDYSASHGFTGFKAGAERGSSLYIREEIDGIQPEYFIPALY